jgi:predicted dehydrogenase
MIRWGIAGPGSIATGFADAMSMVEGGTISAVASRSMERAEAFGDAWAIPARHGDYADLAADPHVDIVYVATPQSRHESDTLLFLEGGKHVLCEKPFALNAQQAQRMVDEARRRDLFLMDAIWSRFLPAYRILVDVIDEGRIGEPRLVEADFGYRMPVNREHRLFRPDLGGGGLLDIGIYPLQLCSLVLGQVEHVVAEGSIGETGVDVQVAALLRHSGGRMGVIKAAIRVGMSCTARIAGTEGAIDIPAFMHCPHALTVSSRAGSEQIDGSFEGNGLRFQIAAVQRYLGAGLTESPVMPLDETIALVSTLDEIRSKIGLVFPGEGGRRAGASTP